jgi:SAM-dependent methyltransferase
VTAAASSETLAFRCNVCGVDNELPPSAFAREAGICRHCGSTVRWRAIVHVLSLELLGESLALPDFPLLHEVPGVGLSDWPGYARPLAERLGYTNTFYGRQTPRLDLAAIAPELEGRFDFVIASDVLEHVRPPLSAAFANLRALLRPGGVAVVSVPYEPYGELVEHFPDLHTFELVQVEGDQWELRNTTRDGEEQVFRDLKFHGGPGSTLEMRIFTCASLVEGLVRAGFDHVELYDREAPEWGIVWVEDRSFPLAARRAPGSRGGGRSGLPL